MKKLTGGATNRRGSGVGATGTAPEEPKPAQKFYQAYGKEGDAFEVPLTDISPNPFNDIRSMGDLESLAASIKEDTVLQDIIVMRTAAFAEFWPTQAEGIDTKYVIAFGERRWRASEMAGNSTITVVLKDAVVPRIRRVLLIENLQRVGYTPMEEARNFLRLHVDENLSYREIARELKIGSTHVSRRLELVKLPAGLQRAIEDEILGVTDARTIGGDLKDSHEQQELAWSLMQSEGIKAADAVRAIVSGRLPNGQSLVEERTDGGPPDVPGQRAEETNAGGGPNSTDDETASGESENNRGEPNQKPGTETPKTKTTASARKRALSSEDRSARERNNAAADRTAACLHLINVGFVPDDEQFFGLFVRTMLSSIQQGPAKTKAHIWLREAGKEVLTVNDADSYFQAVLSSGNNDLIRLATFATALAASEIRAKDNRRQWDRTDAAHVGFLIHAANYQPETMWEREQLSKFNIDFVAEETADEASV